MILIVIVYKLHFVLRSSLLNWYNVNEIERTRTKGYNTTRRAKQPHYTVIPPRARPTRARTPLVHGFWAKIFTPQLFSTTSVLCHFTNTIVLLLLLRFFTNNIGSGCKQKQFDACSSVVNYYFGIFYCSYQYFSIYWEYWNSPLVHGPPSCTVFGHFFKYPRRPCTRGDDCIYNYSIWNWVAFGGGISRSQSALL